LAWLAYWIVSSRNVKPTQREESRWSRLTHHAPLILGAVLLAFHDLPLTWLNARFLPRTFVGYWIGVILLAAGLGFAVWARVHIGRNWSGVVTLKEDHELVRSGPYQYVRHPIYTGLLLAIFGTAVVIGQWRGLIAFALICVSLVLKLHREEAFMDDTFGEEYARYREAVPALIPRPW
jgi:protein-S-isoprenylcysteine O-methyltransferase Ste14